MTPDDPRALSTRVRHRVAENVAVAVVLCLLVAGAGGFVAYEEYAAPDTQSVERTVATWTTDSEFTHRATVRESTTAFDAGTVLRNRSAYLLDVAPRLNATHVFEHGGDAGPATVSTNVTLVKRSVDPAAESSVTYWRVSEPLTQRNTTVAAGESLRTDFTIDVPEQRNESREIDAELGGTPGRIQLYALVTTRVETTLAGESMTETRVERLEILPRATTYTLTTETNDTQPRRVTETVTVPIAANTLRIYGGALVALLGLAGAGAIVRADRQGTLAVPEETVAAMQVAREREKFDEWISRATVPEPSAPTDVVAVASLTDLVDVGIDSERRVIEDTDGDRFVVIVDDTWYVYENESPSEPSEGRDTGPESQGTDASENGTGEQAVDSDATVPVGDGTADGNTDDGHL